MRIVRFNNKGWRARFDDGFDDESVSRIADAFGYIWASAYPGAKILVGYDTRFGGSRFAEVIGGVLAHHGLVAVVSDAPCPTPALGWNVAQDAEAAGAVMLTASGASCEYGGITCRSADGGPIADEFYEAAMQVMPSDPVIDWGEVVYADFVTPYIEYARSLVDEELIADADLSVVVDPMYGAARGILSGLLKELGCTVTEIHAQDNEDFGGLHPVPSEPWVDDCEQAVVDNGADLGLVLDCDGDRLGLIDDQGEFVTPHRMVPLILEHLVTDRQAQGRVVVSFSSSAYLRRQAERLDLAFTAVPMGFARIYREFVEGDVLLGADEFGGVALPSHLAERDGIVAALLLVEYVAACKKSVSQLVDELTQHLGTLHYIRRDIRLDAASIQAFRNVLPGLYLKEVCGKRPVEIGHSDGLVLRFDDDSWVQLRPSRTEAFVRANAEAPQASRAVALAEDACKGALDFLLK